MNIVLTIDNGYSQHAAVVIASVCLNNVGEHHFYIITDSISDDNKQKFDMLEQKLGCEIHIIPIDKECTRDFPIGDTTMNTYVSLATYYRLFMIDLLPQHIGRILYLDCDLVVNDTLDALWNWQFSSNACIAALEDQDKVGKDRAKALGYPISHSYFNAGVLLIDLEKLRKEYSTAQATAYIQKNHRLIQFHDQDVLNALLYDKKDFIPLRYNVLDVFLKREAILPLRYQDEQASLYHPAIIHYSGPIKPWHLECRHPYKALYQYYLSKTPWHDSKCQYKYNTFSSKVIYRLKRMIKSLLNTLKGESDQFKQDFYRSSINIVKNKA